ncbi:hypothetical protein OE88DRAFT_1681874, partial [Heliocybe sulcata]
SLLSLSPISPIPRNNTKHAHHGWQRQQWHQQRRIQQQRWVHLHQQRHKLPGNHYCSRDYGNGSNAYHYSNTDGSYYYSNPNGSTYYNSGSGYAQYTSPSGETHKSSGN